MVAGCCKCRSVALDIYTLARFHFARWYFARCSLHFAFCTGNLLSDWALAVSAEDQLVQNRLDSLAAAYCELISFALCTLKFASLHFAPSTATSLCDWLGLGCLEAIVNYFGLDMMQKIWCVPGVCMNSTLPWHPRDIAQPLPMCVARFYWRRCLLCMSWVVHNGYVFQQSHSHMTSAVCDHLH